MKVILSGSNGQLGNLIKANCPKNINLLHFNKYQLDITSEVSVKEVIFKHKPKYFINSAAYTNVDAAEKNHKESEAVNANGPKYIAKYLKEINSHLIHISTDYVFDGKKNNPYLESDETNPISNYGKTKLLGEHNIIENMKNFNIYRVSWLFGHKKSNFIYKILDKSKKQDNLNIVDDQFGLPTSAYDFSEFIWFTISKLYEKKMNPGIFHFSNKGDAISWYQYALIIFDIAQKYGIKKPNITPINSNDLKLIARRPKYSALNSSKIFNEIKYKHRDWRDSLEKTIQLYLK